MITIQIWFNRIQNWVLCVQFFWTISYEMLVSIHWYTFQFQKHNDKLLLVTNQFQPNGGSIWLLFKTQLYVQLDFCQFESRLLMYSCECTVLLLGTICYFCSMTTRRNWQGRQRGNKENPAWCTGEGKKWKGNLTEGWREGKTGTVLELRWTVHTEKYFRNLVKSNRNQILFTIFPIDLELQAKFFLAPNHSENGKYNLILVWFTRLR